MANRLIDRIAQQHYFAILFGAPACRRHAEDTALLANPCSREWPLERVTASSRDAILQ
jgi:hypothetical protein